MTENYTISTDKSRLDLNVIHGFLSRESYWAQNIPLEKVEKAMAHSLCFGVYAPDGQQVGFARVVTDYTTVAYLSDVFVVESHRGRGLSKKLVQYITEYPELQGLRRWILVTQDAQGLYRQFGFVNPEEPHWYMHRKLFTSY
ncbi:GNAT family N-acetyltransferase [Rudanella paleaurantiibacter]|uniref:GNAT family N-acetyltransferase n=1 Tax=Rudanella paleaurantiibacter TaxID=2614655 RepID=A0A7J5U2T5_9BACT|nr:GNAT family N-acetyltransferase [Rudanella paleaurantiibacter]KAB7732113.1 GNAT family N-acetyltransferase [Rudanella paleaurantiibacter]